MIICLGIIKGVKNDVRNITKLEVSKPAKRNPVLSVKPLSLAVTPGTGHNSTVPRSSSSRHDATDSPGLSISPKPRLKSEAETSLVSSRTEGGKEAARTSTGDAGRSVAIIA